MSDRKPIWEAMDKVDDLAKLDETLGEYQEKLVGNARVVEADAIISGLLLGPDIADELRLASTQLKRAADRALAARVEVKVRIRELQKAARS